jgi:hypothetical protein
MLCSSIYTLMVLANPLPETIVRLSDLTTELQIANIFPVGHVPAVGLFCTVVAAFAAFAASKQTNKQKFKCGRLIVFQFLFDYASDGKRPNGLRDVGETPQRGKNSQPRASPWVEVLNESSP